MSNDTKQTAYFVVSAPGYYGDRDRVYISHRSLEAARRACGPTSVVREGAKRKGDEWLRAYEETHPIAR